MKRASKVRRQRKKVEATAAPRKRLSMANPPVTATMSIAELAELTDDGLHSTYDKVRAGIYPSLRIGRGKFRVLTEPALQILRGERSPGEPPPDAVARLSRVVKKRRRSWREKRAATEAKKNEAAAAVAS